MDNIVTSIEKGILHIAIDLSKVQGRTKGNKGDVIATSAGFRNVPQDQQYAFNMMLYKRDSKKAA